MQKIYIAGPDVFEKDSIQRGEKYTQLCTNHGYIGSYPLDNVIDFKQEKKKIALDIFLANKQLIDECDIVVANLNSFRGKEADSGTVWECGYAFAQGKRVYGYMHSTKDYIKEFPDAVEEDGALYDEENRLIEDFGHPINLMIACSCLKIIEGSFEDTLNFIKHV